MVRFSSRLRWDLPRNRLSLLAEERRQRGLEILDLTESNPTRAGIPYPSEAILRALAPAASLRYEPDPRGLRPAREAVAAWMSRHDPRLDPEHVILTAGTSEAYAFLFRLLLEPGEEVLVPHPSYPLLDLLASLEQVRLRPYPLVYDGSWRMDLTSLERALTPSTRAVVVIHPNHPTGSFLKKEETAALRDLCRGRDLAILSDEVFREYAFDDDPRRQPTLCGSPDVLTFCLDGLSKAAGLPQMKLGWIAVSGPDDLCRAALQRLELVADCFLTVGTPVQLAAADLLELGASVRDAIRARARVNLEWLREALAAGSACTLLPPEGGWTALVRLPSTRTDEAWAMELLREDGVLVHPGYFYDLVREAMLVVSLLPQPGLFRRGVERVLARADS